jgi:hypothetical protein
MIDFLKSFFSGEKTAEEQALLSSQDNQKKRDVIFLEAYEEAKQGQGGCGSGCGGCGCG